MSVPTNLPASAPAILRFQELNALKYVALMGAALFLAMGIYFSGRKGPPEDWETMGSGGGQKFFVMGDGTEGFLNQNSSLYFPEDMSLENRQADLLGEGWFHVPQGQPFQLFAQGAQFLTAQSNFNFRAYPLEKEIEIDMVRGGGIFLTPEGGRQELLPGQRLIWLPESGKIEVYNIHSENFISWRTGKMEFDNTPLYGVADDLADYTGKPVRIEEANVAYCLFSGRYPWVQVDEVLEDLEQMFGLEVTITGDGSTVLSGKGCPPPFALPQVRL